MNRVYKAIHALCLWYLAADNQSKQSRWLYCRARGIISHDRHLRGDYDGKTVILK